MTHCYGFFSGLGGWGNHDCGPVAATPTSAWAGVEVVVLAINSSFTKYSSTKFQILLYVCVSEGLLLYCRKTNTKKKTWIEMLHR